MIPGRATPAATTALSARWRDRTVAGHWRQTADDLTVASLGIGTYLGAPDDATDSAYAAAVARALELGCNVIDTAINYRFQRSERAVGRALATTIESGTLARGEIVVATKGGFVPYDGAKPADPGKWVYQQFIETGLAHPNEFAASYQHCLAPAYLDAMIARSRQNLGLETIDIYYLHNPETQRISNTRDTFRARLRDAFAALEDAVERGEIGAYGVATWTAFRSAPTVPDALSITELVGLAYQVAGEANHFRYVQLPYNLMMTEAFALENQQVGDAFMSAIEAAGELGLTVITSASLKHGLLSSPFMADLAGYFPQAQTDAQCALEFARATPGVTCALVGMAQAAHVESNLALAQVEPTDPDVIRQLFAGG